MKKIEREKSISDHKNKKLWLFLTLFCDDSNSQEVYSQGMSYNFQLYFHIISFCVITGTYRQEGMKNARVLGTFIQSSGQC